jgi:hypothetical protein
MKKILQKSIAVILAVSSVSLSACKAAPKQPKTVPVTENTSESIGSSGNTAETAALAIGWDETKQNPETIVASVAGKPEYNINMEDFLKDYRIRCTIFGLDTKKPENYADLTQIRSDIIDTLTIEKIIVNKAKENGITAENFTEEDNKEADELLGEYKAQISQSADYDKLMKETGTDENYFRTMAVNSIIEEKLAELVTKDAKPTAEEVESYTEQLKGEAKAQYETDPKSYGSDGIFYFVLFTPEGTRTVREIIISIGEDNVRKVTELQLDGKNDEADKLLETELEKIKPTAEKALSELKSGKPFIEVQKEYNSDKQSEQDYPHGFPVTKTNDYLGDEFNKTVFDLKKKGDYSNYFKTNV